MKNRAKPTYGLTVCADPRPGALTDVLQAQSDVLRALTDILRALTDVLRALTDVLRALTDVLRALTDVLRAQTDVLRALTDVLRALIQVRAQPVGPGAQTDGPGAQTDVLRAQTVVLRAQRVDLDVRLTSNFRASAIGVSGAMNVRRMSGDWIASVCRLCARAPNYRPTILLSSFTSIFMLPALVILASLHEICTARKARLSPTKMTVKSSSVPTFLAIAGIRLGLAVIYECYLVDPASSHMLVSKIKPCMCKTKVGGSKRSDTVLVSTINVADPGSWSVMPLDVLGKSRATLMYSGAKVHTFDRPGIPRARVISSVDYAPALCTHRPNRSYRLNDLTAGRWSWKSKSAKECVTVPNQLAPKMDGAEARDLYPASFRISPNIRMKSVKEHAGETVPCERQLAHGLPTLETAQPEVGSSGWKSTARRVVSDAFPAALENPEDRVPLTPGRTHNRIRSPRAGLEDPSSEPVDCWRTARAANAARAHSRVGRGRTGNRALRSFFGRRTANSELCSECQSEEIQPSAVNGGVTMTLLSETTAKGTGLAESAGKEDPVELDSSPTL
ncbi:hypothetical protein Bca101_102090 [Brassica carinata]